MVLAAVAGACAGGSTQEDSGVVGVTSVTTTGVEPTAAPTIAPPTAPPVVIITTTAAPGSVAPSTAPPPGRCASLPTGVTSTSIDAGGSVHDLRIFVPSSVDTAGSLATVLDWHGYDQSGPQQADLSGFETLAEAEGFMVVHPTGVPNPGRSANGWELFPTRDPGRDDLVFVGELIDELVASWCADPTRVYSTGMSDGGFFTSILVCEMADRIAAATSVAGVMRTTGCSPSRVVPYYAFHGTADPVEPIAPDLAAFELFAADAGCGPPDQVSMSAEVTVFDYAGCPLRFFRVDGGGHAWPGSPVAGAQPRWLGYTTTDIDATALSWELFRSVRLPG